MVSYNSAIAGAALVAAAAASALPQASYSCHAACGYAILAARQCADSSCVCDPSGTFMENIPECLECGWSLYDNYFPSLQPFLSECGLPLEPTGPGGPSTQEPESTSEEPAPETTSEEPAPETTSEEPAPETTSEEPAPEPTSEESSAAPEPTTAASSASVTLAPTSHTGFSNKTTKTATLTVTSCDDECHVHTITTTWCPEDEPTHVPNKTTTPVVPTATGAAAKNAMIAGAPVVLGLVAMMI